MKAILRFSCAIAAVVAAAPLASGQSPGQLPPFDPDEIPVAVLPINGLGMGGRLRAGHQSGKVEASSIDRRVTVQWVSSALQNEPPDYQSMWSPFDNLTGSAKHDSESQVLQTNFYPTALGKVSDSVLLVAGMNSANRTIIQKWTFNFPTPMPPIVEDPTTLLLEVELVLPSLSKSTIYQTFGSPEKITGICGVLRPSADPTHALVHFQEPNEVRLMDLSDGSSTLLASASNPAAPLGVLPSLVHANRNHAKISVLDHVTQGHLYRFWRSFTFPDTPMLIFLDADRDGTIEGYTELTGSTFEAQGLNDLSNYSEWWLQ